MVGSTVGIAVAIAALVTAGSGVVLVVIGSIVVLAAAVLVVAAGLVIAPVLEPQAVSSAVVSTHRPSERVIVEKPLIIKILNPDAKGCWKKERELGSRFP